MAGRNGLGLALAWLALLYLLMSIPFRNRSWRIWQALGKGN
jgi:hypothetical protein